MHGERRASPRWLGGSRRARGQRGRIEPARWGRREGAATPRGGTSSGRQVRAGQAQTIDAIKAAAMRRRRPKEDRGLVAKDARHGAGEPEHGQRRGRRKRDRGRPVAVATKAKKGDTPSAQRAHLERVNAVDNCVGHSRAIAQHRPEIEQRRRSVPVATRRPRAPRSIRPATPGALAAAAKKAARQPADARSDRRSEGRERPRHADARACPAVARDISLPSTLSARSLRPVM